MKKEDMQIIQALYTGNHLNREELHRAKALLHGLVCSLNGWDRE